MSSNQTDIYILRHGLPQGDKCLRGQTDFAITEQGLAQMTNATAGLQVSRVISSPLSRCAMFAKEYAESHEIPIMLDSNFAEMDFGQWDGQTFESLFKNDNVLQFFQTPYCVTPPNGEHMINFNQRVQTAFKRLCFDAENETILLVTHAGVMREIMHLVLGLKENDAGLHQTVKLSYASLLHVSVIIDNDTLYYNINL